ncbi:MAG: HAD family hydrolase [Lachnospiraceae bacterium]|nr:HAD family hydrolase [Lachnospiraceae bacterium]
MSALLFFDIDGTLITLDEKHLMPESTREALYRAKENGHKIFINTGRVKTAIDRFLLEFGFDGLVCGCGTYIEYQGKPVFHHKLTKNQCISYASMLREYGYQTVFEGKDRLFIEGDYHPGSFMEYIYSYFSKNSDYPIEGVGHPDFIFDKFTTVRMPGSDEAAFQRAFETDFTLIPHTDQVCEVVPKGFSKATGIRLLADYLGASEEDCYAFGDSVNDMEMLQYVPHSVGMGNSAEKVLSVVEYRTRDILEDGIKEALVHYELI